MSTYWTTLPCWIHTHSIGSCRQGSSSWEGPPIPDKQFECRTPMTSSSSLILRPGVVIVDIIVKDSTHCHYCCCCWGMPRVSQVEFQESASKIAGKCTFYATKYLTVAGRVRIYCLFLSVRFAWERVYSIGQHIWIFIDFAYKMVNFGKLDCSCGWTYLNEISTSHQK